VVDRRATGTRDRHDRHFGPDAWRILIVAFSALTLIVTIAVAVAVHAAYQLRQREAEAAVALARYRVEAGTSVANAEAHLKVGAGEVARANIRAAELMREAETLRLSLAEADARAAEANARVGEASARAAEAEARAAEAEARTAQAQLALEQLRAPRSITSDQSAEIAHALRAFSGAQVVIGAVPPSAANIALADQISNALVHAKIRAVTNHRGVATEIDPMAPQKLATEGLPPGVSVFYMTGNSRAKEVAATLARALNIAGIITSVHQDWLEEWVKYTLSQRSGMTREDKTFEPVTVVVGDKP
jgi:hypothetical protein